MGASGVLPWMDCGCCAAGACLAVDGACCAGVVAGCCVRPSEANSKTAANPAAMECRRNLIIFSLCSPQLASFTEPPAFVKCPLPKPGIFLGSHSFRCQPN